jgi:hypothetical protein
MAVVLPQWLCMTSARNLTSSIVLLRIKNMMDLIVGDAMPLRLQAEL